jgi:ribosomal-protein-alanine N-acetyltransferase
VPAAAGYAAFAPAADQGYMSEGLALAVRYAFTELRLHRLEANIQPAPANQASLRLIGAQVSRRRRCLGLGLRRCRR